MGLNNAYKLIADGATETVYTAPVGSTSSASTVLLTAQGAATATLTVYDSSLGSTIDIATSVSLTANDPWALPKPLMLNAADEIRITVSGAAVGVAIGVYEDTAADQALLFNLRGAYDSGATYNEGDVVTSAGSSYVQLNDGVSADAPPSSNWMVVASKGDSGDMQLATYDPQGVAGDAFARANHTGTQTLATISDAGTAAALNVGTAANEVVQLDGSARLPAVDGSQLTNLPVSGDITGVTAGTGLSGGGTSGTVTLNVDSSVLLKSSAASITGRHERKYDSLTSAVMTPANNSYLQSSNVPFWYLTPNQNVTLIVDPESNGDSITVIVAATSYTITWSGVSTWLTADGSVPTLNSAAPTLLVFTRINNTNFGSVGNAG